MATIGLKNLHIAKVTVTDGVETYTTPKQIAGAISADLTINYDEQTLYADDKTMYNIKEFSGGELKLSTADLLPADQAELLGHTIDDDGVIYAKSDDVAPEFAVAYMAKKVNGTYKYMWLYRVKFSMPSSSAKTKGGGVEFKTSELTGAIMSRESDGHWKAEFEGEVGGEIGTAWFTTVKQPAAASTAPTMPDTEP